MKKNQGFTLVELMIVVGIVAILAAIAVPMYTDHITRSQLVEGQTGLNAYRVQLEQYYQDNRTYDPCPAAAQPGKNFAFGCASTKETFTLTATGNAGRVNGFVYTIDQAGQRNTTGAPTGWMPSPSNCFVVRKGSC